MVYADVYIRLVSNMATWRPKKWASDFIKSENTYKLDQERGKQGNRVLYYLQKWTSQGVCTSRINVYSTGYSRKSLVGE